MKTLAKAVAISSLVLAGSQVMAEDVGAGFDVSANVGVVSNYLFRGISQSNDQGAIQGGIDVKHESGAYLGTWLSSLNNGYGSDATHHGANAEQDLYVGYGTSFGDVSVDLRYTAFTYLDSKRLNYGETHASVSFYGVTLGTDYSTDMPGKGDEATARNGNDAIHYYGSYTYTFPMDIVGTATYGRVDLKDKNISFNDQADYSYWNLGVSKKLVGINWGLSYNNTSLSNKDCNGTDTCDSEWVLSATKSL